MAERSNYNERFAFADPGDVQSGSRSTLYRLRKRALASKQSSYDVEHLFSKENLSYCVII